MSGKGSSSGSSDKLKFINNILPSILLEESKFKTISYNGKNLKSTYLIDLTSHLISRFFLTKDNRVALSSTILRKRYGVNYTEYINYLSQKEIIILRKKHQNGKNSRIYELNEKILDGNLSNYQNYDKILLKKFKFNINPPTLVDECESHIEQVVKEKLIQDLYTASIDENCSNYLLNSLVLDNNTYVSNRHSVDCINNKQIFYHFDKYGRMHTNFTNLKSIFRKQCLYLDGEKSQEIDIKNSQPLFLNKLIGEYKESFDFSQPEIELYRQLTTNGELYRFLSDKFKIHEIKKLKDMVYKVLFGRNYPNKFENIFGEIFPSIYRFIKFYKKKMGGHKILAHKLQNLESNFIFNKVIKEIMDNDDSISLLTVHDSIICKTQDYPIVKNIFDKNLQQEFFYNAEQIHTESNFNIYEYEKT